MTPFSFADLCLAATAVCAILLTVHFLQTMLRRKHGLSPRMRWLIHAYATGWPQIARSLEVPRRG